jgi:cytochrome c553
MRRRSRCKDAPFERADGFHSKPVTGRASLAAALNTDLQHDLAATPALDSAPMNPLPALALVALLAAPLIHAQTSPPAGSTRLPAAAPEPAQLGLCVACHGEDGRALQPGTPHLGGQDEAYLRASLQAYRDGSRKAVAMNAISNALQPDDIDALAAWYAAQPGFGSAR